MKINETLQEASEHGPDESSALKPSELVNQMKSEFHDFVAQTRERLRLVADALAELDRDFTIPSTLEVENVIDETLRSPKSNDASGEAQESCEEDVTHWFGDAIAPEPRANESDSQVEMRFHSAEESTQTLTGKEDASNDANFPESAETEGNVSRHHRPDSQSKREAQGGHQDVHPVDPDSDPFERLRAIKERLARQIEKS